MQLVDVASTVRDPEVEVLGLFPLPDASSFGGVQLSGTEAWQAVTGAIGERRARTLYYQAGSSKLKALAGAVGKSMTADILLVWHLHLLKLLPVLDVSTTRV